MKADKENVTVVLNKLQYIDKMEYAEWQRNFQHCGQKSKNIESKLTTEVLKRWLLKDFYQTNVLFAKKHSDCSLSKAYDLPRA